MIRAAFLLLVALIAALPARAFDTQARAAWVYDMGSNTRKQVRVVGTMAAINLVLGLALGLAGWL